MEFNKYWNFQRGGGSLGKIPFVGEVWIIYGTTQCKCKKIRLCTNTGLGQSKCKSTCTQKKKMFFF